MKWTNSYRSFGLKTKRSTGLKTIEHKHAGIVPIVLAVLVAVGGGAGLLIASRRRAAKAPADTEGSEE